MQNARKTAVFVLFRVRSDRAYGSYCRAVGRKTCEQVSTVADKKADL